MGEGRDFMLFGTITPEFFILFSTCLLLVCRNSVVFLNVDLLSQDFVKHSHGSYKPLLPSTRQNFLREQSGRPERAQPYFPTADSSTCSPAHRRGPPGQCRVEVMTADLSALSPVLAEGTPSFNMGYHVTRRAL